MKDDDRQLAEEIAAVLMGCPCETCTDFDEACEFIGQSGKWEKCEKLKKWERKMSDWENRVQQENIRVGLEIIANTSQVGMITMRAHDGTVRSI